MRFIDQLKTPPGNIRVESNVRADECFVQALSLLTAETYAAVRVRDFPTADPLVWEEGGGGA